MTIYAMFFVRLFPSFPLHTSTIYLAQLYNIIVIDSVMVRINNILITLTIIEPLLLIFRAPTSASVDPSKTLSPTLSTFSQTFKTVLLSYEGFTICRRRSSAAIVLDQKNIPNINIAKSQYFIYCLMFFNKHISLYLTK